MSASGTMTFRKEERLCSRTLIEKLFHREGSRSMAAFPVRLVYMKTETKENEPPVQVMVSVPKRCFKRAVKRNRVKRQVREAYRKNKDMLYYGLHGHENTGLALAFIWLDDKLWDTSDVERKVVNLMTRLTEKLKKE